jgi:hypothetical protein
MQMIGGHDIVLRTELPDEAADGAVRVVRAFWSEAVAEDADTGETLSRVPDGARGVPGEVLVYRDEAARHSWTGKGATPENLNLMVHIIRGSDSMTLVVDDPSSEEMSKLIEAIRGHVDQDIFWMRADAA